MKKRNVLGCELTPIKPYDYDMESGRPGSRYEVRLGDRMLGDVYKMDEASWNSCGPRGIRTTKKGYATYWRAEVIAKPGEKHTTRDLSRCAKLEEAVEEMIYDSFGTDSYAVEKNAEQAYWTSAEGMAKREEIRRSNEESRKSVCNYTEGTVILVEGPSPVRCTGTKLEEEK